MFYGLSGIWLASIAYTKKIRNEIDEFIEKDFDGFCKRINVPMEEFVDLDTYKKQKFLDLIPILNVANIIKTNNSIYDSYHENKDYIFEQFPIFAYHENLEINNKERQYNGESTYFIGYNVESKPHNIFFTIDGDELAIYQDLTSSLFQQLEWEDEQNLLLYLLYVWYNGGYEYLNGSQNLHEVFNEFLVTYLKETFKDVDLNETIEEETKLTRKLK